MAKQTRRTFLKKSAATIASAIGLSAGGYLYAHNIEPNMLQTTTINFENVNISRNLDGLKIVQFSDTHLGFQYTLKQLEKLIAKINSLNPDLICFTGDLIDNPNTYKNEDQIISILNKLNAPLGKFAVYGNHDHGGYGTKLYRKIMTDSNFKLLVNEAVKILHNNEYFYLIGVDDAMLGKPSFSASLQNVPKDSFKILLSHAPDLADEAADNLIHLQLSGHSHGGQIKVPFIGAIVKPPFGEKYVEGEFLIGNEHQTTLYVNRGLGTTRLPYRFLSRPELAVINLKNIK